MAIILLIENITIKKVPRLALGTGKPLGSKDNQKEFNSHLFDSWIICIDYFHHCSYDTPSSSGVNTADDKLLHHMHMCKGKLIPTQWNISADSLCVWRQSIKSVSTAVPNPFTRYEWEIVTQVKNLKITAVYGYVYCYLLTLLAGQTFLRFLNSNTVASLRVKNSPNCFISIKLICVGALPGVTLKFSIQAPMEKTKQKLQSLTELEVSGKSTSFRSQLAKMCSSALTSDIN